MQENWSAFKNEQLIHLAKVLCVCIYERSRNEIFNAAFSVSCLLNGWTASFWMYINFLALYVSWFAFLFFYYVCMCFSGFSFSIHLNFLPIKMRTPPHAKQNFSASFSMFIAFSMYTFKPCHTFQSSITASVVWLLFCCGNVKYNSQFYLKYQKPQKQ